MGTLEFAASQIQGWVTWGPAADVLPGWHLKWGQSVRRSL